MAEAALRRWRGGRLIRGVLPGAGGSFAGFVAGWVGTAAVLIALGGMLGVSNREGVHDVGAAFVFGPLGGIARAVLSLPGARQAPSAGG